MTDTPVSYGKSRLAGNRTLSCSLHPKANYMPGQPGTFTTTSLTDPGVAAAVGDNQVTRAFKRQTCATLCLPVGPRDPETCPHGYTFDYYAPYDDEALDIAIQAAYRQVYGNFHAMESERAPEMEERLLNGDITIREFVRQLAKSPFYRSHYYDAVNQQRAIELCFKHLLGRPPSSQAEVIACVELMCDEGFEGLVDALVDSAEYEEVYGPDTVPYLRCWNSPCGITTSSFNRTAALARGFATSDNAIHGRITVSDAPGGKSQLVNSLARGNDQGIKIPTHVYSICNLAGTVKASAGDMMRRQYLRGRAR